MPSPFPGMDPYLEHPDRFPGLHDRFINYLAEVLQPSLPPPYLADIGRRAWLEISERYVQPDVEIMRPVRGAVRGSTAVMERPASEPIVIHVPHDERRELFLEVFIGRGAQQRLVTLIEILSLSNKTPGQDGRVLYQRKQREILDSQVNLVEIDLLRSGRHTTSVPESRLRRRAGHFDYHVCIHRFDRSEDFFVHPFSLEQPLPDIDIPLLPDDGSIRVDLQAVFNRCYNAGPYPREIDYQHDQPEPPLTDEQQAWARELLKQKNA